MNILILHSASCSSGEPHISQASLLIRQFLGSGHGVRVVTYKKNLTSVQGAELIYSPSILKLNLLYRWCDILFTTDTTFASLCLQLVDCRKKWIISHDSLRSASDSLSARLRLSLSRLATKNIVSDARTAARVKSNVAIVDTCYDEQAFKWHKDVRRSGNFIFRANAASASGNEMFIRACAELDFPFTAGIVGDGAEIDRLQGLVKRYGLGMKVTFWRELSNGKLPRLLSAYKYQVFTTAPQSHLDVMDLEAAACGCRLIKPDNEINGSALNNITEYFRNNNLPSLKNILAKTLVDNDCDLSFSDELRHYLLSRSSTAIARRFLEIFKYSDYSIVAPSYSRDLNHDKHPLA